MFLHVITEGKLSIESLVVDDPAIVDMIVSEKIYFACADA
jgi:hypothetical protein